MTDYYVKNGGNDGDSGLSDAEAWETITHMNSINFANNDIINLKRNSIFIDATLTLNSTVVGRSGITVQDYGIGNKPWINGNFVQPIKIVHVLINLTLKNIDISGQDWLVTKGDNIDLDNINGIVLDGIEGNGWYNYKGVNQGKNAITMAYCSGHIEIKNCNLYNWGLLTLPVSGGTDYCAIHLSQHDNGILLIHNNIAHDLQADAVQRQFCSAPMELYHNTFYNCGENCYDDKGSENSKIYENNFYRDLDFTGPGQHEGFLVTYHGEVTTESKNHELYNNYFSDTEFPAVWISGLLVANINNIDIHHNYILNCASAFKIGSNTNNVSIYNNCINGTFGVGGRFYYENNANLGIKVYNNTFYSENQMSYGVWLQYSNAEFINNIFYMNDSNSYLLYKIAGNPTLSNNIWYNNANTDYLYWEGTVYTVSQLANWLTQGHSEEQFTNPLFVNITNNDFNLQATSPAKDAGVDVGLPFVGVAPDIGAIEYGLSDPCENVICDDICVGTTRYHSGVCIDGECLYAFEENSEECGYISEGLSTTQYLMIGGVGIALLSLLSKK